MEFGLEYLWPISGDRQIQTASIDFLVGKEFCQKTHISLYAGATLTRAWGHILQFNEFFQDVRYDNSAYGIGPNFLMRWAPIRLKRLSLSLDTSGGIIIYSEDFPAGGDFYNFMWRIGPSLLYQITSSSTLVLGYKWMHVSNGQGMTDKNPSYEGRGLSLHVSRYF